MSPFALPEHFPGVRILSHLPFPVIDNEKLGREGPKFTVLIMFLKRYFIFNESLIHSFETEKFNDRTSRKRKINLVNTF